MRPSATLLVLGLALAAVPAGAQEAPKDTPGLTLELNGLQPVEGGCRITFVATNGLPDAVERAAYELAFFDAEGLVSRLAVVDFLELAPGKSKVRQFQFPGTPCPSISRLLLNDATECTGPGLDAGACMAGLRTANRTDIEFGV
jgi:hypothetical protein